MRTLDERRPRCELAWGVSLICGVIIYQRDRTKEVLGDSNSAWAFLRQK